MLPLNSGLTPDQPNRRRTYQRVSSRELLDSVTTFKNRGFYRIEVLRRQVCVAEYYIVKGFPKPSYWSVLTSDSDFHSDHHFKSLTAAKHFCIEQSV
jgi:hypothetical protein